MPILFWGAFFGFLASIFVNVAKVIVAVIKVVVPIIAKVFKFLGDVVVRVGSALGRFARAIADAADALWDGVLKPVVNTLVRWFQKFQQFLEKVFKPIFDILEKINSWLDKIWTRIIEPILDVIEKIRLVFKLLAELGVDWAGAVDRFLQQLETRIYEGFREVREWVNTVELWLDILLDPRGWIKSVPFLYTTYLWGGNIWGILVKLGLDPLAHDRVAEQRETHPVTGVTATADRFKRGEFQEHPGIQLAAARFRSGETGNA